MAISDTANTNLVLAFANNIAKELEEIVWAKDVSYLEAALLWCQEKGYPEEELGEILKKHSISSMIEQDAEALHFLKKKGRLPV